MLDPMPSQDSMQRRLAGTSRSAAILAWITVSVAAVLCVIALAENAILFAGVAGAVVLAIVLMKVPDVGTTVFLFLLYTNSLAIAVKFHGVPGIASKAAVLLLVIPLGHRLLLRRQPLVFGPSWPCLFIYLVAQTIGGLLARDRQIAWESLETFITEGVLIYGLVTNLLREKRHVRWATWALVASGIVLAVAPLVQRIKSDYGNQYGGFARLELTEDEADLPVNRLVNIRQAGAIGEKNRFAQVMLVLAPLAVSLFMIERANWLRGIAMVGGLLALIGASLALSRGAVVGVGLAIFIAAALGVLSRRQLLATLAVGAMVVLALPQYRERLASIGGIVATNPKVQQADGAVRGRVTEMIAAIQVFRDHPVFGVGPGMFRFYSQEYGQRIGIRSLDAERQAHCLLLDVAAETGVVGLLSISLLFLGVTYRLHSRAKVETDSNHRRFLNGYLIAVVLYFTTSLFLHFAYIRYFWILIALADSTATVPALNKSEPQEGGDA